MDITILDGRKAATKAAPTSGSDAFSRRAPIAFTPASGSESPEWFYAAAQTLLGGTDPGLQLSALTGYPVTSCRAYVAKLQASRRRPPEHFVRAIVHEDEGFFRAFMHGCQAPWWLRIEHAAAFMQMVCERYDVRLREG